MPVSRKQVISHRSSCQGNVHLNNDSKSLRSIPIASLAILNPIIVRCVQSASALKSHKSIPAGTPRGH